MNFINIVASIYTISAIVNLLLFVFTFAKEYRTLSVSFTLMLLAACLVPVYNTWYAIACFGGFVKSIGETK
jgi:hypothetical protein